MTNERLKVDKLGRELVREYFSIPEVTLPVASVGICKYWKKCGGIDVTLGNGVCIVCWDKGLNDRKRQSMSKGSN